MLIGKKKRTKFYDLDKGQCPENNQLADNVKGIKF